MTWNVSSLVLMGVLCLTSACASTATGKSTSAFTKTAMATQTLKHDIPAGTIAAVVRYPAFVESNAEDAYYDAFGQSTIGGKVSKGQARSQEAQALADSLILKSNYFALSLFKELAAKLPEHSVLLSPHKITLGADGKLTSEPMTQAESLPNIVAVDFASYTFPDSKKMMGKAPLTFGDLFTPLVSVRTDHRAAAATQGVLLASRPLVTSAAGNGQQTAAADMTMMQNGRLNTTVPELDFVTFLKKGKTAQVASASLSSRTLKNTVASYPVEKVKLDKNVIKSMNDGQAGTIDPLKKRFSAGFANQVVGLINNTNYQKAAMAGRAEAIAQFDESLAALTLTGSDNPDYMARMRYAERLLDAEKKYLSVQSLRLFDGVHNGEMGAQMRDMLRSEYEVLARRRDLARKQNAATALSILGAVAAGGVISNEKNVSYGESLAINALIQGAIFAGTQAISINRQSKSVGNNYLSSIVPALEEQTSVQVDLIDSNETITAIRFDDLKAKLQTLYARKQRSLNTVATRCAYTHQGITKTGTWLGMCENGLANGTGVGVLRNADGTSVEYYGYAQNGKPEGAGYMIHHKAAASHALEGQFIAGRAEGVMRVSRAGSPDSLEIYRAGVKEGSAPKGAKALSPFTRTAAPVTSGS